MDKFVLSMGAVAMGIGAIFFFVILGTFLGAVAGWIVGLVFGDTILGILSQFGVHNVTMWQFGAFMGFAGSFLKTKVTAEVKAAE